jgi:hypothetical protein
VADEPGPVYRASKVSRGAAWIVMACAAGLAVARLTGEVPTSIVVIVAVFGLFAWAALRLEVRATPDALVVCGGRTTRRFRWADVRGFEVDRRTGREIAVLLKGNARRRLPIVDVATRRLRAEDVRADLERYWKAHRRPA